MDLLASVSSKEERGSQLIRTVGRRREIEERAVVLTSNGICPSPAMLLGTRGVHRTYGRQQVLLGGIAWV